jgi:hypothetical protein
VPTSEAAASHSGALCTEHRRALALAAAAAAAPAAELGERAGAVKKCPNPTCGAAIVRYRGHACHAVTCTRCHLELCFAVAFIVGRCPISSSCREILGCSGPQAGAAEAQAMPTALVWCNPRAPPRSVHVLRAMTLLIKTLSSSVHCNNCYPNCTIPLHRCEPLTMK